MGFATSDRGSDPMLNIITWFEFAFSPSGFPSFPFSHREKSLKFEMLIYLKDWVRRGLLSEIEDNHSEKSDDPVPTFSQAGFHHLP